MLEDIQELLEDSLFYKCLQHAGVDNWDGYDYALEEYNEGKEV